jgi:hypothetical protein
MILQGGFRFSRKMFCGSIPCARSVSSTILRISGPPLTNFLP